MPSLIVLHYTAMASAREALTRLCDPKFEVSAHYLIAVDGTIYRLVDEDKRAWHAGAGSWCGMRDINSRSIGIELDNDGQGPFSPALMGGLEALLTDIMVRHEIRPEDVIGHSDMAPGRKVDPGPWFPWARLAKKGLAASAAGDTGPADPTAESFRDLARQAGYSEDVGDAELLAAVRLRWRQGATGPLCAEDFAPLCRGARGA